MATRSALRLVVVLLAPAGACSPDRQQLSGQISGSPAAAEAPIPLDTLLVRLRAAPPDVRVQAAQDLAKPGPRIEDRVRALDGALSDPNRDVGQAAAWSLGRIGLASVHTLTQALSDPRPFVRARAVYGLGTLYGRGQTGQQAMVVREAIHSAVYDPDRTVRRVAQWAMGQTRPRPSPGAGGADLGSVADLRAGLAASDPQERLSAVRRFQPYPDHPDESIRLLLRGLGDADPQVRGAAADALLGLGPPARAALTAALSDSNPIVRREASVALVRLGVPR